MKHFQLINHIKGSFLKEEYLEAFLLQSIYIEAMVKTYAEYSFYDAIDKIAKRNVEFEELESNKILLWKYEEIKTLTIMSVVLTLHKSELILDEQKKSLIKYIEQRNRIVHSLLEEMITQREEFENQLKEAYELGENMRDSEWFKKMVHLVDRIEGAVQEKIQQNKQEEVQSTTAS